VGFSQDAGTVVLVLTVVLYSCTHHLDQSYESQARSGHHCQTLPKGSGPYGSGVRRDPFWPAVHEGPAVVAQDQRVFQEEQPLSHDQSNVHMPLFFGNVEETRVPVTRPCVRGTMSEKSSNH